MAEEQSTANVAFDPADEYRPEPPPEPEVPAWKDGSLRIGIHTSIAGDVARALELAHGLGANALQIFSSSPRMWGRAPGGSRIAPADAARFRQRRRALHLGPLVVHDNYLINLAAAAPVLRTRSVQAFHEEIVRARALGADYLVAHPGSAAGSERASAIRAVAEGLRQAARGLDLGELEILLENTAGQGSSIGWQFEELREIMALLPDLALGVCLDTAHLFEAGWDIRRVEGLEAALAKIDRTVGLERVKVVHVNDSKTPLGSRVDRHAHIGKGKIGAEGFRAILNHPALAGRAFILETPIDRPGDDRRNVATLWRLAGHEPPKATRGAGMKPRRSRKKRARRLAAATRRRKSRTREAKREPKR